MLPIFGQIPAIRVGNVAAPHPYFFIDLEKNIKSALNSKCGLHIKTSRSIRRCPSKNQKYCNDSMSSKATYYTLTTCDAFQALILVSPKIRNQP